MKRTWLLVSSVAVVLGVGCAPVSQPLFIEKFFPLETGCVAPANVDEATATGGTLDISAGPPPAFFIGVQVAGADGYTQRPVVLASGQTLEAADRNKPIIDRIVLSYTAKPTTLGLKLDSAQFSRNMPIVDGAATITPVNLITQQVADELLAKMGVGDVVELSVSVEVRGYMSGDCSGVTSGALIFPLSVIMSDVSSCTNVRQPDAATCLYPGQSTGIPAEVCCDKLVAGTSGCP